MKIQVTRVKTLDETDFRILEKIMQGKCQKQIALDLYVTRNVIVERLREMRKVYNCQTTPQLIAHLTKANIL